MTRSKFILISFSLALNLALSCGQIAFAQAGPVQFTVTAADLTGTVTCPDGTVVTLTPVDPATTGTSGNNEATLPSSTVTACGKTIYQATNLDDKTDASDTSSLDDADGENIASNIQLLGSLVTAKSEDGPANCTASPDGSTVTCGGTGTFKNLAIGGSLLPAGARPGGTTFNIVQAQIVSPTCLGVELFTGKLVLADSTITNNNSTHASIEIDWLHLTGESVCVLTGATTKYDLRDEEDFEPIVVAISNAGGPGNPLGTFTVSTSGLKSDTGLATLD